MKISFNRYLKFRHEFDHPSSFVTWTKKNTYIRNGRRWRLFTQSHVHVHVCLHPIEAFDVQLMTIHLNSIPMI